MKKLITISILLLSFYWSNACSVTPLCGYNGSFTFRGDPGYSTFAHVQSVDANGNPNGVYDSLYNFPLGTLQTFIVPATRIKVTWEEDSIVNFAESNGISCAPLAITIIPSSIKATRKGESGLVSVSDSKHSYNMEKFSRWMDDVRSQGLDKKVHILAGVTPLKSVKMAERMKFHVPGTDVPNPVYERIRTASDPTPGRISNCLGNHL